jgi:hypothetical protein
MLPKMIIIAQTGPRGFSRIIYHVFVAIPMGVGIIYSRDFKMP